MTSYIVESTRIICDTALVIASMYFVVELVGMLVANKAVNRFGR